MLLPGTVHLGVENSSCQEADLRFLPWLFSPAVLGPEPSCATLPGLSQTLVAAFIIFILQMRRMRILVVTQLPLEVGIVVGV